MKEVVSALLTFAMIYFAAAIALALMIDGCK
jgi:hypothetical protein